MLVRQAASGLRNKSAYVMQILCKAIMSSCLATSAFILWQVLRSLSTMHHLFKSSSIQINLCVISMYFHLSFIFVCICLNLCTYPCQVICSLISIDSAMTRNLLQSYWFLMVSQFFITFQHDNTYEFHRITNLKKIVVIHNSCFTSICMALTWQSKGTGVFLLISTLKGDCSVCQQRYGRLSHSGIHQYLHITFIFCERMDWR